jgi:hypothetical protein
MDLSQNQPDSASKEQMLQEILENSKKTQTYMKWQLYITIVLVVIPLLCLLILVPYVFHSLSSSFVQSSQMQ